MKRIAVFASAAFMLPIYAQYCWATGTGGIHPLFATWLLFFVAVLLSFWTYWSSEKHGITDNILNAIDTVGVTIILFSIVFFGHHIRFQFNRIEIACLAASGAILILWRITKWHGASNVALQIVMTIAYLPTFYQLWYATRNTESLEFWIISGIGVALSLIPPIIERDKLAILYATRALMMGIIVIILILRIPS